MPERRFMPRRLHYPVPLVWNLTAPQFAVLVVTFIFFSAFVMSAGSAGELIIGLLCMGISLGAEFLLFMILQGTERSFLKHCVSKIKYGLKVPPRYAGR